MGNLFILTHKKGHKIKISCLRYKLVEIKEVIGMIVLVALLVLAEVKYRDEAWMMEVFGSRALT